MAKKAIQLVEKFSKTIYVYDGKEFPGDDINETDMIAMLSSTFPEVSNATTETTIKDEIRYIEFVKKAGTKGASPLEIVKKLNTLHALPNVDSCSLALLKKESSLSRQEIEVLEKTKNILDQRASAKNNVYRRILHLQPTISSAVIIEGI